MTDANWKAYGHADAEMADRLITGEISMPQAIEMLTDLDAGTGRCGDLDFHHLRDVARRAAFQTNMHDTLALKGIPELAVPTREDHPIPACTHTPIMGRSSNG